MAVLREGRLVAVDTPAALCAAAGAERLEDAVISLLEAARAWRCVKRKLFALRAAYWVWRRELHGMLRAPILYVVGGVFLVVQGIAFAGLVA